MTTLSDIERGYESKYGRDLEADFKAIMRRNKLLGLWAAEQMEITGDEAEAYAREVIESDFEAAGHEDVVQKVLGDLQGKNVDVTDHIIRRMMDELLVTAKAQLTAE